MGYRPRPVERAPGACHPGYRHSGVPVELSTGEIVAWVCQYCLIKLARIVPPSAALIPPKHPDVTPFWTPQADDGTPLPELPLTRTWR